MPQSTMRDRHGLKLSPELASILGFSAAAVVVVVVGSGIVAVMPDPNVWQIAAAYLAPASLAFVARWWMDQER